MKKYDVVIIGAGPGGIFSAYELAKKSKLKIAVLEEGMTLEKRHCPIDGKKIKSCINCKSCSIISGFGGAGAFSDGKYNIRKLSILEQERLQTLPDNYTNVEDINNQKRSEMIGNGWTVSVIQHLFSYIRGQEYDY